MNEKNEHKPPPLAINEMLTARCTCGGLYTLGIEGATDEANCVLHEMPMCKLFEDNDPTTFLMRVRTEGCQVIDSAMEVGSWQWALKQWRWRCCRCQVVHSHTAERCARCSHDRCGVPSVKRTVEAFEQGAKPS